MLPFYYYRLNEVSMGKCNKARYFSRREAKKAVKRFKQKIGKLRPYKCDHCNLWHLTSMDSTGVEHARGGGTKETPVEYSQRIFRNLKRLIPEMRRKGGFYG